MNTPLTNNTDDNTDDGTVAICYRVADKVLAAEKLQRQENGKIVIAPELLRIVLAKAAAYGYGEAGLYLQRAVAEERAAFAPNGAAVEHGRTISVVTESGKKITPPRAGFFGWLGNLLR